MYIWRAYQSTNHPSCSARAPAWRPPRWLPPSGTTVPLQSHSTEVLHSIVSTESDPVAKQCLSLVWSVLVLPIPLASPWRWCMYSWFLKSFLVLYLLPLYRIEWILPMVPYHSLSPCRIIVFMLNIIFLLTFLHVPPDCELIEGQPMSCSSLYLSCPVQNTFKYVFVLQWMDNGWINTFCWEFC